ncbi:MAG TPA: phage integrase N-terminal SAM-like domain-containing protein, partial [Ilumatobacteraceae bacterium]|nr:phage integrase N-terminal SAM-like domain-containing protein [Ilumatobacteraceae bacterium]
MNGQQLITKFLQYQAGRGFSPKTAKRRQSTLARFLEHIDPLPLDQVTLQMTDEWLLQFTSPATRHAYQSDLAAFYRWAVRRSVVVHNPMVD